jgi:hypothetical protein
MMSPDRCEIPGLQAAPHLGRGRSFLSGNEGAVVRPQSLGRSGWTTRIHPERVKRNSVRTGCPLRPHSARSPPAGDVICSAEANSTRGWTRNDSCSNRAIMLRAPRAVAVRRGTKPSQMTPPRIPPRTPSRVSPGTAPQPDASSRRPGPPSCVSPSSLPCWAPVSAPRPRRAMATIAATRGPVSARPPRWKLAA